MSGNKHKVHYHHLRRKWTEKHKSLQKNLWEKHGKALDWAIANSKHVAVGTLGGLMMLATPVAGSLTTSPAALSYQQSLDKRTFIVGDLAKVLPSSVRPLTQNEESVIADILSRDYQMKVSADLEGKRLNRSYGLIGAEQHLALYPGDTTASHFDSVSAQEEFASSGMAPGLGAWRYFAPSKDALTQKDIDREKYYIAVQSFLIPDYNQHVAEYRDFLKYRKMLVVNPQNGKAVVADIADAGPAEWTGKHLGGSPEVMKYLERKDGGEVGAVLYFFIDDANDTIPLGPVSL